MDIININQSQYDPLSINTVYHCDTSNGTIEVTLPVVSDKANIELVDVSNNFTSNHLVIHGKNMHLDGSPCQSIYAVENGSRIKCRWENNRWFVDSRMYAESVEIEGRLHIKENSLLLSNKNYTVNTSEKRIRLTLPHNATIGDSIDIINGGVKPIEVDVIYNQSVYKNTDVKAYGGFDVKKRVKCVYVMYGRWLVTDLD